MAEKKKRDGMLGTPGLFIPDDVPDVLAWNLFLTSTFCSLHRFNNGQQLMVQMEEASPALAEVIPGRLVSDYFFLRLWRSITNRHRPGPCRQHLLGIQRCDERSPIPTHCQI
jgi:hypothetical protein